MNSKQLTKYIHISEEAYVSGYMPMLGWVLIEKDLAPEKMGTIIISDKTREEHLKFSPTGIILRLPPINICETEWESYKMSLLRIGDRVGYSASTPILSPSPPAFLFDNSSFNKNDSRYVTLHCADIISWHTLENSETKELSDRISHQDKEDYK